MSWNSYVDNLLTDGNIEDAAIVGIDTGSVWAASPNGFLKDIKPADAKVMLGKDRSSLFSTGASLGEEKCTVLRDNLDTEDVWTMDLRTKTNKTYSETRNVCIAKSKTAMIMAVAKKMCMEAM